jgi:predicted ATPase/class 3 adenylate cyclase
MRNVQQRSLPSGTVTFLFSDVEGSTKLLHALGTEQYGRVLTEHRRVVREAFEPRGGVEVGTEGDSFFVVFPSAVEAVAAAKEMVAGLADGPIRIRIGLHTGAAHLAAEGYIGIDIHLAARIAAAGHGGQVLISGATAAAVGTDGLRDLGEHRLKDFSQPVAIFQLGEGQFAPLKTISNTNLPRPASSFVGRDSDVAEVASLLRDGARLLTLTGPGGSGKTRLAIEAATTLVGEFKAGVFWVDLAPLRDPALVPPTIGEVLGAKDSVAEHVGEREMLLLLDNLEQVVEAAPALAAMVEACRNLRLLVTSRERLRVRGEVEYPVAPLAEPDAVALFCARAGVEADDVVRRLCAALDNLPLALELAAARARVLTPSQILDRLSGRLDLLKGGRDADPRQRTLRATIEWSYGLLNAGDQRQLGRLSVFRGGWTFEAAESVTDADVDSLESLVDKSLVRHADDRFWMLETIREYATERLEATDEAAAVRGRHAAYFLAEAESAAPHLRAEELGAGGRDWLDRQARDLDNARAALDFLEASDSPQLALRMAGALAALWANPFWASSGLIEEGRARLDRVLRLDASPTLPRAKALDGAAEMAHFKGDIDAVLTLSREALALYRALGDQPGIADSLASVGAGLGESRNWNAALPLLEESLEVFRGLGDDARVMWGTRTLAWAHASLGHRARARELYEDALDQARRAGNRLFEGVVLGSLASVAVEERRPEDAPALVLDSLRILREVDDPVELSVGLAHAAEALAALGDAETAARLIGCFDVLAEDLGGSYPWVQQMNEESLRRIRDVIDGPVIESARREGRETSAEAAVALALMALEAKPGVG